MITASAPGKCILLGEHSVVYGYPAIAVALEKRSYCTMEKLTDNEIHFSVPDHGVDLNFDDITDMKEHIPNSYRQFYEGLNTVSKEFGSLINNLSVRIYSDLWKGSGLGSSASTSIAFLTAATEMFNLKISSTEINNIAFLMEKIVHGTPSGIDNTVCSSGGAIVYQNGLREKLIIPKFPILITYSGSPHNTGQIIHSIREKKDELEGSFQKIGKIVEEGIIAIKDADFLRLGEICDNNQKILSTMGLSTPLIDDIIAISRNNGAFGSKLTGAGAGGSVITLGPKEKLYNIQYLLKKKGYLSEICKLDYTGGKIESC
ncbi:MAG: mevalonate kinase [Promethearchaeota archaeon]|nr:MAG: mevalonate kinase [Candidatus Lokiarchaeota archaeon]